jgi:hypothetical protein
MENRLPWASAPSTLPDAQGLSRQEILEVVTNRRRVHGCNDHRQRSRYLLPEVRIKPDTGAASNGWAAHSLSQAMQDRSVWH